MKHISITLLLCLISFVGYAQVTTGDKSFATVAELRAVTAENNVQVSVSGNTAAQDGNGGMYMYNTTSTQTDDGFSIIKPTSVAVGSPGRWLYVQNQNTIKGLATVSGAVLQTSYSVSYGSTLPAIPTQIHIQAITSDAASALSWIDPALITTTGFVIKYNAVPVIGTNNIKFWWLVIKR